MVGRVVAASIRATEYEVHEKEKSPSVGGRDLKVRHALNVTQGVKLLSVSYLVGSMCLNITALPINSDTIYKKSRRHVNISDSFCREELVLGFLHR